MNLKQLLSLIAIAAIAPISMSEAQAQTTFPDSGSSKGQFPFSKSSSDLVNQNQNTVNNNDTRQTSTGVVQQSATYNVGQASTYDFRGIAGTRIYCPKPSLLFSGGTSFGGFGSSSSQFSGAVVVPLGGKLGKNCTKVSNQIVKEQEQHLLFTSFQNQYEMASRCANLKKSGASINPAVFPELAEMCQGVNIAYGGAESAPEKPASPIAAEAPASLPAISNYN